MKTIIGAVLFSLLAAMSSSSFAGNDNYDSSEPLDSSDVIVDLFAVRPLGAFGTAAGAIMHGVGLLFSVPGGNYSESAEVLVEEPLHYTFNRPLGRFEESR
jgi:hypothetical protein